EVQRPLGTTQQPCAGPFRDRHSERFLKSPFWVAVGGPEMLESNAPLLPHEVAQVEMAGIQQAHSSGDGCVHVPRYGPDLQQPLSALLPSMGTRPSADVVGERVTPILG